MQLINRNEQVKVHTLKMFCKVIITFYVRFNIKLVEQSTFLAPTYGGDDRSSKEEGAAHVPVAGVVRFSNGPHSCAHSVYSMLQETGSSETDQNSRFIYK